MKKIFLALIIFLPFIANAQFEAGEYINGDTSKISGVPLIYPAETAGENYYRNMRDPSDSLDGVNLRTLFQRLASFDSLGLLVSDIVSGNQTINSGETQIYFPSAFDSNNVTVVPYVRRVSDDAVIDYVINDVDSNGFDIVVWEDNVKLSYVASNKISHSSDIFSEPIYSSDSMSIKRAIRAFIRDSVNFVWFNDTTENDGFTSRLRHSSDLALKQNLLVNSAGLAGALNDETGSGLAVFNTNPTFTSAFNTTVDDVTVANKNKYRPLLSYNGTVIARFQDYYWNGSAYAADNSFGFGFLSLLNNSGANASGFGFLSLQNNSGANASGFGFLSLQNNSGAYVSGFGTSSLQNNSGANASGFGTSSLQNNSGANASGFGTSSLLNNSGANASGFGYLSLLNNSGANASGFGYLSLQNNSGAYASGFGFLSLQNNSGANASGFGFLSLQNNSGAYVSGFGTSSLRNNNWANVIAVGAQSTNFFLDNPATDKIFDETCINATNKTITFPAPHGFGATNAKVNLRFTTITGTAPGGLTTNTVYQFTITSATVLTYSGITSIGSEDFTGKLTNSVDINNSIAIGNDVNASKANQVVIGKSTIVETQLFGDIIANKQIYKGSEQSKVPGVMFTQTSSKTIENTTTETSLLSTGSGTLTLPANCLIAGKTIRCKLSGYISANNGVNTTINIKIGSVTLVSSTSAMPKALTSVGWEATFEFTCRTTGTTGTAIGQGGTLIYDGQAITTNYTRDLLMTSTSTVNTTVSNTLDITYTWGTADSGNSITCTNAIIEILN